MWTGRLQGRENLQDSGLTHLSVFCLSSSRRRCNSGTSEKGTKVQTYRLGCSFSTDQDWYKRSVS